MDVDDDDMIIVHTLQPPTTLIQEAITLETGARGDKHQDDDNDDDDTNDHNDDDIPIPPNTTTTSDYPELETEGLPTTTTTMTSTTLDGHPGQHHDASSIAPSGELDLEMNMNIKRALQRVIEGFDDEHDHHHDHHHDPNQSVGGVEGPGDMSATLQQQEEYMRRNNARLGQDELNDGSELHHHHHHHDDDEHEHDPRDNVELGHVTLEGDRDNIFQHFASIDLPHPTHPHPHSQTSTPQPGSPSTSKPSGPATNTVNTNTATPSSTRGSKRKRPVKIKGPIPPVDDDPSRPLTEEEIKRRQNRSRASGRVLARGNACEFCKRRKLRCDGEKPICTNCLKAKGKRECVYLQKDRKTPINRLQDRVSELESQLSVAPLELTPEAILPDPTELIGTDLDQLGGPSGTTDPDLIDAGGAGASNAVGSSNNFLAPHLDGLDLPSIDMTGSEHHDGFNALFEQSAAAAEQQQQQQHQQQQHRQQAEDEDGMAVDTIVGVSADEPRDQNPGEVDPALGGYPDDSVGRDVPGGSSQGPTGLNDLEGQQEQGSSGRQTGQEPYLMTLANAAEVASDVPTLDQQGNTPSTLSTEGRKKRARTGSALSEQDSVWAHIWSDLKTDLQDVSEVDDQTGGMLVGELIDVFYKRAEAFYYTRSLNRLHAAFVSGPRPQKCLIFAILGIVATSRINGLSADVQTLARRLGSQFLNLSQRDFLVSLRYPDRIIDAIQSAILVAQVYYSQAKVTEGWLLITQAMRLATMTGLHQLRIEYVDEQVLEQLHLEGVDTPQLVTRTEKRPVAYNSVIPRTSVLAPPDDLAELGERIHVFWTCLMVERTGCLALSCSSTLNDTDILTPWPRPIFEYTHESTSRLTEESLTTFWDPNFKPTYEGEDKPKDSWFLRLLKAMTLLHAAEKIYNRSVIEPETDLSIQKQQISEVLQRFSADLPEDCLQLPPVTRKRLLDRDIIWAGSAIHAVKTVLHFSGDPADHTADMLESCEFVVRVSKAMSVPERPKLDSAIVILWYLTSQHLRGLGDVCWLNGKVTESKKASDLIETLRDSTKMLARVSPLALSYIRAME